MAAQDGQNTMQGRVCLVTGATSGLGKAVALGLARRGATVVLVERSRTKGEFTLAQIKAATGNTAVTYLDADLASQAAVRQLAEAFKRTHDSLHVLVNNAAIYRSERAVSPDGLEMMFATNHLGYFLLTNLLLGVLERDAPSCIFNVTAPSTSRLNFDDLQGEGKFSPLNAFGASKSANLLFTFALARRVKDKGIVANAYHPGIVRSGLMREAPLPIRVLLSLMNPFARTPDRAAEGLVGLAAVNANGATGQLFHDEKIITAAAYTQDPQVQERLWEVSARLADLAS
jgi:NAD(P)-dependent dehydrogenase (short-subunit alcohol dehydrogenase family)